MPLFMDSSVHGFYGCKINLKHFMPLVSFNAPEKHQNFRGFLIFSGCIKRMDQWYFWGIIGLQNIFEAMRRCSQDPRRHQKKESFVNIVNGWKPLTIAAKFPILDVCEGLDYISALPYGMNFFCICNLTGKENLVISSK